MKTVLIVEVINGKPETLLEAQFINKEKGWLIPEEVKKAASEGKPLPFHKEEDYLFREIKRVIYT